jgi:hypothetical protein
MKPRPTLELVVPSASPAEAAAIVAALERFMRETAPAPTPKPKGIEPWLRAAMLEGISSRDLTGDSWGEQPLWASTS